MTPPKPKTNVHPIIAGILAGWVKSLRAGDKMPKPEPKPQRIHLKN